MTVISLAALTYATLGYTEALREGGKWRATANALIDSDRGPDQLTQRQLELLVLVIDPGFIEHNGLDPWRPGAGLTTISQDLASALAFDDFKPGYHAIRQASFAFGLEKTLKKNQILALYFSEAEISDEEGLSVKGLFNASEKFFGQHISDLEESAYLWLLASLMTPHPFFAPQTQEPGYWQKVARIENLLDGPCGPRGPFDAWLIGCAAP